MLNRTLVAVGGKTISNDFSQWTCARYNAYNAWRFSGAYGCLNAAVMCDAWLVASLLSQQTLTFD